LRIIQISFEGLLVSGGRIALLKIIKNWGD